VAGAIDSSALAFGVGGIGAGWTTASGSSGAAMAPTAPVSSRAVDSTLRTTVAAINGLVSEAQRQAKLGRDLFGNPLQTREDHAYEARVLQLVNAERAKYGLGALVYDRQLDRAAEGHNAQQAATRTMSHDAIGDGDPGSRIAATGFRKAWGENVAAGQTSPEQVVAEWMASPGHRRNILDADFRRMGVSYSTSADGRAFWAQEFGA
jgi:uncharacterized protein YkwD